MTKIYYEKCDLVAKAKAWLVISASAGETRKFQKTLGGIEFEIYVTSTKSWLTSGAEYFLACCELDFESFGYDLPALLVDAEQIAKKAKAPKPEPKIYISNKNLEV